MLRKRAAQIYRAHGLAPFATFTGHWKGELTTISYSCISYVC
jgi:hypothetical protein